MKAKHTDMIMSGLAVLGKIGKKIFIEGGKAAAAGAIMVGMEKIYHGGIKAVKDTTVDEFLEMEYEDEEV